MLTTGVTISGKSLIEHSEVHGHANGISLLSQLCKNGSLTVGILHQLHNTIQTGVSRDIFKPIGAYKVEANGTMTKNGWRPYALPQHVSELMQRWFTLFQKMSHSLKSSTAKNQRTTAIKVYAALHVAFTRIHPYADGNGRLARLLSNIPLMACGLPPILIEANKRSEYIALLNANDEKIQDIAHNKNLYEHSKTFKDLMSFLDTAWSSSWELVERYQIMQKQRHNNNVKKS